MTRSPSTRERWVGLCPPARGACIAGLVRNGPAPVWIVVSDEIRQAESLAEDVILFGELAPENVLLFPESQPDGRDLRETFAASHDRLAVLSRLQARRRLKKAAGPGDQIVLVTTPAALLQEVPALEALASRETRLRRGQTQPFTELLQLLNELDYDAEAVCEAPGQYAVRGGLVDVYPASASQPYRLDFMGDELEEIRAFDPVTQRSAGTVEEITLSATPGLNLARSRTGLTEYLSPAVRIALTEPAALDESVRNLPEGAAEAWSRLLHHAAAVCGLSELDEPDDFLADTPAHCVEGDRLSHFRRAPEETLIAQERLQAEEDARSDFLRELFVWKEEGYGLLFVASRDGEEKRMREILLQAGWTGKSAPAFRRGNLNEGFRIRFRDDESRRAHWPGESGPAGLVVVTETEIFGRQRRRRPSLPGRASATRGQVDQMLDFADLVEGDLVVHLQHGVAIYRGVTSLDTAEGMREVISLEFDDRITLHVPLPESHLISRYVGLGKARPQLGKIGSGRWEKSRRAAERATVDLAAELLRLQAEREARPGLACGPDTTWQKEFEAAFPFTETPDQLRAIQETKSDLERTRPMDRLICGDVGFGKTEVAIRAAFKVVQEGRQVAVVVPTTVLAQQHLNTFRERMAGYPLVVEMLSRFRTRADQKRILAATAAGQVDILIGTHRLLQADVHFRELGLVVMDEEHRFGVRHKETLKRLRATVDVLCMSATPIPRTLHLALTGARDMSVIETPPTNRHPIQTFVRTYDDRIVVDAIHHEIRRGGQVFYLHNQVATIEAVASRLRQLLPELRITVGHGQMEATELEQVMTDFVAGNQQVLVCTTIIESGLDLPNCNTIIIEGADRFGLAQLYQLRGRVGRFRHQAYAYLLLHRHTRLLEIARQRLGALRSHNQLGAGFRIALRDLELRGAGNLLGPEQSGHIASVGFDLYCQLLRQSVARLKGDTRAAAHRATVKLDFVFLGDRADTADDNRRRYEDAYTAVRDAEIEAGGAVPCPPISARLPREYVAETRLRLDLYRRLALAGSVAEVRALEHEMRDRFGKFGNEVKALLRVTEIRVHAEQKGLLSVESDWHRLKCLRPPGTSRDWIQVGSRFPRLTASRPLLRLQEIITFLKNLP